MSEINYGLMCLLLRNTFTTGYGTGQVGGIESATGLCRSSVCHIIAGAVPRPDNASSLRVLAQQRLTAEERRRVGMKVERSVGVLPGMAPRSELPVNVDFRLLVETLRDTYAIGNSGRLQLDTGIHRTRLYGYGSGRQNPTVRNGLILINLAFKRLTDHEFDQCCVPSSEAMKVAA